MLRSFFHIATRAALLTLLLLPMVGYAQTEQIKFAITDGKRDIGELTVTRQMRGDQTTVHVESSTRVRRLVTLTVEFDATIEYNRGQVVRSDNKTMVNGFSRGETKLLWHGDHYVIQKDGEEATLADHIVYTGSLMYFVEPEFFKTVFSEKFGEYDPIVRLGNGRYRVEKSDGTYHTYTYQNGQLQQIEYPHSMMDVIIVRK